MCHNSIIKSWNIRVSLQCSKKKNHITYFGECKQFLKRDCQVMVPDEKERWWSVDSAYITTDKTALKFNVPVSTARTHSSLTFNVFY